MLSFIPGNTHDVHTVPKHSHLTERLERTRLRKPGRISEPVELQPCPQSCQMAERGADTECCARVRPLFVQLTATRVRIKTHTRTYTRLHAL